MDILDDMGVSKLSAKVFFKSELLLYPFKKCTFYLKIDVKSCVNISCALKNSVHLF